MLMARRPETGFPLFWGDYMPRSYVTFAGFRGGCWIRTSGISVQAGDGEEDELGGDELEDAPEAERTEWNWALQCCCRPVPVSSQRKQPRSNELRAL
ncbi:hypothetical protein GN956_G23942 [Arapaima gigas]